MENGVSYLRYKNYDLALHFLTQAAKLNPAEQKIYFSIGITYEGKKQYRKAIRDYCVLRKDKDLKIKIHSAIRRARLKKRLSENPILNRDMMAHNLMAALSFYMGDVEEVLRSLNLAMMIDPKYIKNYTDMATYTYSFGYESESVNMLQKARRLDPNSPLIKSAEEMIKKMADKKDVNSLLAQGMAYITVKQFSAAKSHFEKMIRKYPDNFLAYGMLAKSELSLGLTEDAQSHRAKAIELFKKYESEKRPSESNRETKKNTAR